MHGHLHAPVAPNLRLVNACVVWIGDAWLAREYGGPVQLLDLTRFPDATTRAITRGAYERYRYAVLEATLRPASTGSCR